MSVVSGRSIWMEAISETGFGYTSLKLEFHSTSEMPFKLPFTVCEAIIIVIFSIIGLSSFSDTFIALVYFPVTSAKTLKEVSSRSLKPKSPFSSECITEIGSSFSFRSNNSA